MSRRAQLPARARIKAKGAKKSTDEGLQRSQCYLPMHLESFVEYHGMGWRRRAWRPSPGWAEQGVGGGELICALPTQGYTANDGDGKSPAAGGDSPHLRQGHQGQSTARASSLSSHQGSPLY